MKRFFGIMLVVIVLFAAGCSRTAIIPKDEAHMGAANFIQTSVTIKAGQPVKFIDDKGGAPHILVMGSQGKWESTPNSPTDLNNATGITIQPGEEKDIVFNTPGSYTVTCTIHQSMLLTVTVTQ